MTQALRRHTVSFKNALNGIRWALASQPNFRVHLVLAFLTILFGIWVKLTDFEWTLIIFTIFWALSAEMINTAVESVCDLVTTEWKQEIKIAKDVSAGMMLTVAVGAVMIAIIILLPKLITQLMRI